MSTPLLFDDLPRSMPDGFRYHPQLITADEEQVLLERIAALPFEPFRFQQYVGKRQVVYFGWAYDFIRGAIAKAPPIPDFLAPARRRIGAFADLEPERFEQVLINAYEPDAPLGWHRDRPQFDIIAGLSLGAPARFRMRRRTPAGFDRRDIVLEPRSAYLLSGAARKDWEHSLPPAEALRYSITFRAMRG